MRVLIDACVLYPTVMREMVLGAADQGLFEPMWSARILEEWARASEKNHGPAAGVLTRGDIALLSAKFPRALARENNGLADRLYLPDPNDIHVLASAISGSADVIMTMNAKDFPRNILAEEGLSRVDPDNFLRGLCETAPDAMAHVADAVHATAERLSGEVLDKRALFKKARLPRTGKALG